MLWRRGRSGGHRNGGCGVKAGGGSRASNDQREEQKADRRAAPSSGAPWCPAGQKRDFGPK
ncbi:MAG: hypothetical protein KDJ52_32065 [Anaerolineae bacterium]|nr:hypothetical protein [Anaerolineae bacterium]